VPGNGQDRFRIFEAVISFLRDGGGSEPLVVVLDDLHRADTASLQLLQFLVHSIPEWRALLIGTFRDAGRRHNEEWLATLSELLRQTTTHSLPLAGLTSPQVRQFLEAECGEGVAASLTDRLYVLTEGNPLFVSEYVRVLRARSTPPSAGEPIPLPAGIQAVLRQRVAPLPPLHIPVLQAAAVNGREFDERVLAAMFEQQAEVGWRGQSVRAGLDAAIDAGIIVPAPGAMGCFAFSHVLLRDCLYDDLEPALCRRLHARAADAMASLHDREGYLADIASHRMRARPDCPLRVVVDSVRAAGDQALRQLAYEAAAELYHSALSLLAEHPANVADRIPARESDLLRGDLLIRLGETEQLAGRVGAGDRVLNEAWAVATRVQDPTLLARAAIASKQHDRSADGDAELITRLRLAASALPDNPSELRVRVLACLANETARVPGCRRQGAEIAGQAVTLARRQGDPVVLSLALRHWYDATWTPDSLPQRTEVANELLALALARHDRQIELEGLRMRIAIWLEVGNMPAADHDIDAFDRAAHALRQRRWLWWVPVFRGTRALMCGRFDEAVRLAHEAMASGQRAEQHDAAPNVGSQLLGLRVLKGDLDAQEIRSALAVFGKTRKWNRGFEAAEAYILSETGAFDEARTILDRLAVEQFADFERDSVWLSALSFLARAAYAVDARPQAKRLYDLLLPYKGRTVTNPSATFCYGAVDELLGLLSACVRSWADGQRHFEDAIALNTRMQAPPFVALASHGLAELHGRAPDGDRVLARQLAERALGIANDIGMASLQQRIVRLLARLPQPGTQADQSAEGGHRAAFRRQGGYWALDFAGRSILLRASKGMAYLGYLLQSPGRGIHALDLLEWSAGGVSATAHASRRSEAVDTWRAKRLQLLALRDSKMEAEELGDAQRSAALQARILEVAKDLTGGLSGKPSDESLDAAAERARSAVTKRIKDALRRIAKAHPALGDHLMLRIQTGTICRYVPDPRHPIDWQS
jgi:tetratricopeptide (TPR) repeat protein